MKIDNPYSDIVGNWHKGALHTHSNKSDGSLSPEELINYYKNRGYSFFALTDHSVVTDISKYRDNNFITFNAEELSNPHVIGLNINSTIEDKLDFSGQIKAIQEQNGLAIVSHPYWMGLTMEDLLKQDGYIGIEIFNNICEEINGKGYSLAQWDELLSYGRKVWGFAVDDCHINEKYPNTDRGWIMVKSKSLTRKEILDSIKNGNFYSSTGPQINNIEIIDDTIKVDVSCDVNLIRFIGQAWRGRCIKSIKKDKFSYAEYKLVGDEKYIRIECLNKNGKIAWSNPIFMQNFFLKSVELNLQAKNQKRSK